MHHQIFGCYFFIAFLTSFSLQATSKEFNELEVIMSSWAKGSLEMVAVTTRDNAVSDWVDAPKMELGPWDMELLGPLKGRLSWTQNGEENAFFVELGDGVYINRFQNDSGDETVVEHELLEANFHSPDNWSILVAWKKDTDDAPQTYAEMSIAGDVFVRTDFVDDKETGERKRTSHTLHRRIYE